LLSVNRGGTLGRQTAAASTTQPGGRMPPTSATCCIARMRRVRATNWSGGGL